MKKEMRQNLIKALLFVLLVYFMGSRLLEIFGYKDMGGGGGWYRFYREEGNDADVYIVGSSQLIVQLTTACYGKNMVLPVSRCQPVPRN